MKKNLLKITCAFMVLASLIMNGQDRNGSSSGSGLAFDKGNIVISAGYGFPNLGKSVLTAAKQNNATNVTITGYGPIHVKGEYALTEKIGFGLSFNYVTFTMKDQYQNSSNSAGVTTTNTYTEQIKYSTFSLNARMNVHFATQDKLDPYWGIGAGYRGATWSYSSNDPNNTNVSIPGAIPFGFETTLGLRYYFTPNIAAYTEIGYAKSLIQFGLTGKF